MQTLVIGDLHLDDKVEGYLDSQLDTIASIMCLNQPKEVIFLGDVFMHRNPSPKVLATFKSYLTAWKSRCVVHILRGNHDSANKSDDGLTALEVYRGGNIKIWNQAGVYEDKHFIPHYEDEETIRRELQHSDKEHKVFGHFGYRGCLNSAGDADSTLSLSDFQCKTYLGHIHSFKQDGLVTLLGTPYSTNFGEAGTKGYYLILHGSEEEFHEITFGPRHIVGSLDYVRENLDYINNTSWFTLLRINLQPGESASDIPEDLNVAHLDIKLIPSFTDEDAISHYKPKRDMFHINDQIIEDYVDNSDVSPALTKEVLMEGYNLLKKGYHED